jgi:hypothetical protein
MEGVLGRNTSNSNGTQWSIAHGGHCTNLVSCFFMMVAGCLCLRLTKSLVNNTKTFVTGHSSGAPQTLVFASPISPVTLPLHLAWLARMALTTARPLPRGGGGALSPNNLLHDGWARCLGVLSSRRHPGELAGMVRTTSFGNRSMAMMVVPRSGQCRSGGIP